MPSVLLGNPSASGAQLVCSGAFYSGFHASPVGGIQLKLSKYASGMAYIGLSGGMTVTSGALLLSGGCSSGLLDGMELAPGDAYFIPKSAIPQSGVFNIWAMCDGTASGQARLFFEVL